MFLNLKNVLSIFFFISQIFFLAKLSAGFTQAQPEYRELFVKKDTSFTVFSTFIKERQKFPFIEIADFDFNESITVDSNLVYVEYRKRKLRFDIVYPINRTQKYPAVLLIHGGGWRSGDKSQQIPMAKAIASAGFVTVTVEYRLSPEAKYPAAILDLKAAIRWLRANSEKYKIDTNKIAALGCSSGGHLVSMLGVTNDNPKFEGDAGNLEHSSTVEAVIDIDGVLDFTDPAESGKDDDLDKPSVGKLWLGYTFKENPEIWSEASPVNYVDAKTPPFLFVNSSIDRFHAGREILIEKLKMYQTYSEIHTFPYTPHTFWLFHPWFNSTNKIIIEFLNKIFEYKRNTTNN